jgi:predicted transcriptional regulator
MTILSTEEKFNRLGLNDRRVKIYLYLLENIEASAYRIHQDLKFPKATVYNDLLYLLDKQLVTKWKKNNKLYFTAEAIRHQKVLLEEKMAIIESLIPDLNELRKKRYQSPEVKIYTGKEGIKTVFDNMLEQLKRTHSKQRYIFSHPEITDQLPNFIRGWAKEKEKLGVFTYSIVPEGIGASSKLPEVYSSNYLREVKTMPPGYMFEISVSLDGDQLTFFVVEKGNLYAITIESVIVSRMFKQLFTFVWDQLPKSREVK